MEFEFDAWEDIEEEEAMDQEQLPEWDFKINMGILKKQDAFIDLFDNGKIVEKFRKIRSRIRVLARKRKSIAERNN
jgi:hypothetical protein